MTSSGSSSPLVSILMTAYNREQYIAEAIESVLASTFKDFELIVVDDCSHDRTVDIARRYLTDPRIQVHVNQQNLGDYPNRNRAASLAQGKYLKYLDSDDVIYPFGLEVMVMAMEQFPDAGLGICRPASDKGPYPMKVDPAQAYREHFLVERGFLDYGPSFCIIRTNVFRELRGFNGMRFAGDTELWLRIAARYPVVKLVRDLVWWRIHPGQEYQSGYASNAYHFLNSQINETALSSQFCPLSPSDKTNALARQKYLRARQIWRTALRQRQFRDAIRLYNQSGMSVLDLIHGLNPWREAHR